MASRQMLQSLLPSARMKHVARSHLFLHPKAGLRRNKFWKETMQSDALVFDFQDGCPPGMRSTVAEGLGLAHITYPNMKLSVRVTELERDETHENGSTILDELSVSMKQKQVYWIMLPMRDSVEDVKEYINMINYIDPSWLTQHGGLQMVCETPLGLKNLQDILGNHKEIKGVIAGGGDYFRFAQCENNLLLPQLRWDVLNACLCHGVVPIDTPPLAVGLECGLAKRHFQSAHDSGFRSGVLLHPLQTKIANNIFSPCPDKVEEYKEDIYPWLEKRQTGYKLNSGNDFVGPPHMKQKHWYLKHHDNIRSKATTHIESVDDTTLSRVPVLLSEAKNMNDGFEGGEDTNATEFLNTLVMISLSTTCHPRHNDLIANLGFSNVKVSPNKSYRDARYVSSQIIGRRQTSSGYVIVTTKVQILDESHQTLCELERRLVERKLEFDDSADEVMYSHLSEDLKNHKRMTVERVEYMIDQSTLIESKSIKSVSTGIHYQYCDLLHLDAPLHHVEEPTVPSTLHLSHHALDDFENLSFKNITFHAPMKSGVEYIATTYVVRDMEVEEDDDSTWHLSVLRDGGGTIFSSALFQASV